MPTAQARALSIQEQQALELIAQSVSAQATALYEESANGGMSEAALMAAYALLIGGAVKATAQARVAYLQGFAAANGKPAFKIPRIALNPRVDDFLVDGVRPEGAIRHVQALNRKWESELDRQRQSLLKRMAENDGGDEFAPMSDAEVRRRAAAMAGNKLGTLAESTVTSAADFVTRSVLDPDKRIAALRRVIHPGACDRCQRVAAVLVFKAKPRLRHDQCRCSFEPVYTDDPEYQNRLMRYRMNAAAVAGGRVPGMDGPFGVYSARWARDTRARGRRQLRDADARENSLGLRKAWDEFLQDEENRVNNLVRTIKSNTFREWDVMVDVTESLAGGAGFPAITRR